MNKESVENLALFGGKKAFSSAKSTSNLLKPDVDKYLQYSRAFFDAHQFTDDGPNVRLLEERLAEFHQTRFALTFCSGFWGIALAIRALMIPGKTEIIMPSLTYRRMPDIAVWLNLKPRFCEVDPVTLAPTPETIAPCINENTAMIIAPHPIVNCVDAKTIADFSVKTGIPLVFDSVESMYESTDDGRVGGFGKVECFSLHACKLLNGFGGGYVTTNDSELAQKLKIMRDCGFEGRDEIEVQFGLNAKLNEMHACLTLASLDDVDAQVVRNRERYYAYRNHLRSVPGLRLLEFDETNRSGYKNIVVELLGDWPLSRELTIKLLNSENILARAHFHPALHARAMNFPHIPAKLPLTDKLAEKFLNLPCGHLVSIEDIERICKTLKFLANNSASIKNRVVNKENQ